MGLAIGLLLGALVATPAAAAAPSSVGGGTAVLQLNRGLYGVLKQNDVRTMRLGGGVVNGRFATVPLGQGEFDPVTGVGGVALAAGIKFATGERRAPLGGLVLRTTKRSLTGLIRNKIVRVATLTGVSHRRDGFGVEIDVAGLRLTARAAQHLNERLGLDRAFRAGRSLGSVSISAESRKVALRGSAVTLVGAESTFAKLRSLDVDVVPFEAATVLAATPPTFSFPSFPGGSWAFEVPSGVAGETGLRLIQRGGTLELPVGSPVMSLVGLSLSLEAKTLTADVSIHHSQGDPGLFGYTPIATLDTAASTTALDPAARTISVAGLGATINAFLAEKLNEAFAVPKGKGQLFGAGEPLGVLSIAAQAE